MKEKRERVPLYLCLSVFICGQIVFPTGRRAGQSCGRRVRRPYGEGPRRMRFLCLDSLTDFGHDTGHEKPVEILIDS
jgi:hypothetical protein